MWGDRETEQNELITGKDADVNILMVRIQNNFSLTEFVEKNHFLS